MTRLTQSARTTQPGWTEHSAQPAGVGHVAQAARAEQAGRVSKPARAARPESYDRPRSAASAAARPAESAGPRPSASAAPRVRPLPVRGLTVLYDPACRICAFVRDWLAKQRQLVRLDLVPVGSPEARRRFPELDHAATEREITVIGDAGQVYRGDAAWVVCLWALAAHRPLSHTLATPAGRQLARAAVLTAASFRQASRGGTGRTEGPTGRHTDSAPTWWPVYGGGPRPAAGKIGWDRVGGRPAVHPGTGASAGAQAGAQAGAPAPAAAPAWVYDPAVGWTSRDPGACADGCSPPG